MGFNNKLKSNKGISGTDLIVSIIIITVFVGTITNMFYQLYLNTTLIRMNAMAVNYAVNILEYTDELSYEEVNSNLNDTLKEKFRIPEKFDILLTVENYNGSDPNKMDIVKELTLTVNYSILSIKDNFTIRKLKIKEM